MDKQQWAREQLIRRTERLLRRFQDGDKAALPYDSDMANYRGDWIGKAAIQLLAAALPDEQPAQGEVREKLRDRVREEVMLATLTGSTGSIDETTSAILRLLAPPAGPAVEEIEKKLKRAWQIATDRQYMIDHLVQMLGPKGREVWKAWQEQGLQRVHVSWGPDAVGMDGEQIAQLHLDMNEAAKNAQPIDDVDAYVATSLDGLLNDTEKTHAQ